MTAVTPTYGWVYPTPSDPLSDVRIRLQSLALAIEATLTGWGGIAAPGAWIVLPLVGTLANLGGGFALTRYRKIGNIVSLRGTIAYSAGAIAPATVVANLPAGFRPPAASPGGTQIFVCASSAGYCRVDVNSAGQVIVQTNLPATSYLSFDQIEFTVD